ncbi:MAG: radical SAM protein [Deltaproteobacteria bacterium]|nr:radical SAM protein [Deltaproteobacteria bacterium]
MDAWRNGELEVRVDLEGARRYLKVGAPLRFGRYSEIRTSSHVFHCGPGGAVRFVQGRGPTWPHPADWLKRTARGDWVYYSAADYRNLHTLLGEYYLPCLPYPSNAVLWDKPFGRPAVHEAIDAAESLPERLRTIRTGDAPAAVARFLAQVGENDSARLAAKTCRLHEILGDDLPVLPPDARHVDYDVLPVLLADGCRHQCRFCTVRSRGAFRVRPQADVDRQIDEVAALVGPDLPNHAGVFLAQHDALAAGAEAIEHAARRAFETFGLERSLVGEPHLFFFGSVRSLLEGGEAPFATLERLPYRCFVNVGLESADPETLETLGKPVTAAEVKAAFERLLALGREHRRVEVTANFVLGERLPAGHLPSLANLCSRVRRGLDERGTIYLSPLVDEATGGEESRRRLRAAFRSIAPRLGRPTYLYLIQRL